MKKIVCLYIYLILFFYSFSLEYSLDELTILYEKNILTLEDYEILKSQIIGTTEKQGLYLLKLNNRYVANDFVVKEREGAQYLDLIKFIDIIGLKNIEKTEKALFLYLGENLERVEFNLVKQKIHYANKDIKEAFFQEDNEIFVKAEVFEEIFLNHLEIDKQNLKITMSLNFTEPKDVLRLLDYKKEHLEKVQKDTEVINGVRKLIAPGYLRIKGEQIFEKSSEKKSYKKDWKGELEYQSSFLYGELTGRYDLKNEYLGTLNLDYNDIWKGHTLKIENRRVTKSNNHSSREWGFSFYKDKGYYNLGEKVIIKESVPIGSRVELLYMGTPIEIKDEENGSVIFDNELIKTDKTYELKVYTSDNGIYKKEIKPTQDYNRQAKNEIKYSLYLKEDKYRGGKYRGAGNIYYGVTDKMTLGGGIRREVETIDFSTRQRSKDLYIDYGNLEAIYGGVYNGVGYTLKLSGEKAFSNLENGQKSYQNNYTYSTLGEIKLKKYDFVFNKTSYGRYYSQKEISSFKARYDFTDNIRLDYHYDIRENYEVSRDKNSKVGIYFNKRYKNILFASSMYLDFNDSGANTYNLGAYYSGFQHMTIKFENRWKDSGKSFESILTLYNNNFKGLFDVATELRYEKEKKDMFTLKVTMKLDDLFTVGSNISSKGERNYHFGIDKIIDLENPKLKIENLDISRANIFAYLDNNGNDKYDKGEEFLEGVEIRTGKQKAVTDKHGRATLYALTNGMEHTLKITVRDSDYIVNRDEIKVLSNHSSEINVYIPVKTVTNIGSRIEFDRKMKLSEEEKQEFYSNIVVSVIDSKEKIVDLVTPDDTGYFDISGLMPEEYRVRIKYLGKKYKLAPVIKNLKLNNGRSRVKKEMLLRVSEKSMKLESSL